MSGTDKNHPAPPIRSDERLGRRVTDPRGKKPRRLHRLLKRLKAGGGVPYQEFLSPLKLPAQISADRVDQAPTRRAMAGIALRDAQSGGGVFHGWAAVTAEVTAQNGRKVQPSPVGPPHPPNPHHADIVIPGDEEEARHARRSHAENLAENAEWLEWRRQSGAQRRDG